MSLEVIKTGLTDTLQDSGRFGFQHLGINSNGTMDLNAMKIANALVGNVMTEPVIELSFPASVFRFKKAARIALSGAEFTARINGKPIPINQVIEVPAESKLEFLKVKRGSFCYLTVQGGFDVPHWLNSASTNLKAGVGGYQGRILRKGDILPFKSNTLFSIHELTILKARANVDGYYQSRNNRVRCVKGREFEWLTKRSQAAFLKEPFSMGAQSDRMGYQLKGIVLKQTKRQQLISTAVTFGTIQLLSNGGIIVLMADHQTTGGYPRLAHVIRADRSTLAQTRPNDKILFEFVTMEEAEQLAIRQEQSLRQLHWSCRMNIQKGIA